MKILVSQIAKTCHEVNRAYCQSIGDNSQAPWEASPEWQKQSIINGVIFHLDNPGAGPDSSHENWLKDKAKDGWTWGAEKDVEKKQHPCFVPYRELPAAQQLKDSLFKAVVDSLRLSAVR